MRSLVLLGSTIVGSFLALLRLAAQDPVINEIHSSPDIKQERVEFVELYWPGETPLALGGWSLSGGVNFTFPPGSTLPARGYLVVAQDPASFSAKFGGSALGPWTGRLAGDGERLNLRDQAGAIRDTVGYGLGFPWPTVGDAPGYSLELIHPSLDNDLGGHWRASVLGDPNTTGVVLLPARSTWRLWRGTQAPAPNWQTPVFDDRAWESAPAPVGYDPEVAFGTTLGEMRGNYTQFFLRRSFTLSGAAEVSSLRLEALFDDGFKVWINGVRVVSAGLPNEDVPLNGVATGSARENNGYEAFDLAIPSGLLRDGENLIAVQVANVNLGSSSDCFFDGRLSAIIGPSQRGPTPGRINVVFATNAPPAIRQVAHTPRQPRSGQPVTISAKVTDPDGVAQVTAQYQLVEPGSYAHREHPEYTNGWTTVNLQRSGADPDVFEVALPADLSRHRRLIRYRLSARDSRGASLTVPYLDDPSPNFALFCYDEVPAWQGTIRPGATGEAGNLVVVPPAEMNRLPTYHLFARKEDVEDSTWFDRSHGDEYFWTGTLVYDGEVYDHIRFRPRGGVWRYAMGKNMWKFDFNRGHDFQALDNWGRPYRTRWTKLNLGACIQQGDYQHRGEQGLFESVGFRLFQLAGLPAPHSTFVQFRIIDEASEAVANDQYTGDFWGLYLAIEQLDGRFLDEHGLPDGNLYKMEAGTGEPNNLGPDGPTDSSDLNAFLSTYNGTPQSESWWRSNLNLDAYFSYQAVVQAIHHYDIADGKNYFYYRHPEEQRWTVLPWDLDLTWADNMYRSGQQGGDEPFKSRVLSNFSGTPRFPAIAREFRNRVREFRDLLWNEDEAYRLIDEYARRLRGTNDVSFIDADRAQWDFNPVLGNPQISQPSKAGQGRFYRFTPYTGISRTFDGAVQIMKRYVTYRGQDPDFSLDTISAEPDRPLRPTLVSQGPPNFPANQLRFARDTYQGSAALKSVRWRVAEISRMDHPSYQPDQPMAYEINATWDSGEQPDSSAEIAVPSGVVQVGRLYRARVRYTDQEGRTSNWSPPVEFTVGEPDQAVELREFLRLTEVMYNPPPEGFEFIELHNASPTRALALEGVTFTEGIAFTFPKGASLQPGGYGLLIRTTNSPAFRAYHGLASAIPIFGPFEGSLDNGGEPLRLQTSPGGSDLYRFSYGDEAPWPAQADGDGYSLVVREEGALDPNSARHWRRSTFPKGSPGSAEEAPPELNVSPVTATASTWSFNVQCAASTAWVIEASNDLVQWTPLRRQVGSGLVQETVGTSESRFLRVVVE